MTDPRTWEDALREQGKETKPGASYRCPNCEQPAHAFAIVEIDGEWRCALCRLDDARQDSPEQEPTWDDVRGVRLSFLTSCDWTQLADIPERTQIAWADLRQQARDVTSLPNPKAALDRLEQLRYQGTQI